MISRCFEDLESAERWQNTREDVNEREASNSEGKDDGHERRRRDVDVLFDGSNPLVRQPLRVISPITGNYLSCWVVPSRSSRGIQGQIASKADRLTDASTSLASSRLSLDLQPLLPLTSSTSKRQHSA